MQVILGPILGLIDIILGLYVWVLLISIILSWLIMFNVVNTSNRFIYVAGDFLHKVTEPALRPIQRFIPFIGGMDISPIILLLAIWFIRDFIRRLAFQLGV